MNTQTIIQTENLSKVYGRGDVHRVAIAWALVNDPVFEKCKKEFVTMKKTLFLIAVLLASWVLVACSAAQTVALVTDQTSVAGNTTSGTNDSSAETLPTMQLALAAFQLEGTDYQISAEQAATLLPLWKAARSLSNSDTTATQEFQAVVRQIQGALTAEQLQVLQGAPQDMATLAEKYGLELGAGAPRVEMQATLQAAQSSVQTMPAGPGSDMLAGGPPGGAPPDAAPQAALSGQLGNSASGSAALGLNSSLLDAVIEFLENKVQ